MLHLILRTKFLPSAIELVSTEENCTGNPPDHRARLLHWEGEADGRAGINNAFSMKSLLARLSIYPSSHHKLWRSQFASWCSRSFYPIGGANMWLRRLASNLRLIMRIIWTARLLALCLLKRERKYSRGDFPPFSYEIFFNSSFYGENLLARFFGKLKGKTCTSSQAFQIQLAFRYPHALVPFSGEGNTAHWALETLHSLSIQSGLT